MPQVEEEKASEQVQPEIPIEALEVPLDNLELPPVP